MISIKNWANIGLFLLIFFYAWQMTNVFGFVQGLHLCALALGFFCLATPFLAIFTSMNAFFGPRAFSIAANMSLIIFVLLFTINFVTFRNWPEFYHWTGITSLFFRILKMDVSYKLFTISSIGVLINTFLANLGFNARWFALWTSLLVAIVLCFVFYSCIPEAREAIVIDINGAIDNF